MKIRHSLLLAFLLLWNVPLWADVAEVPIGQLQPSREERQATLIMSKVIGKFHYKQRALDNAFSEEIFDRYLKILDPNKRYFTQQDIEHFELYRDRFDDVLRWASLEPPFEIFRVFRQRVEQMAQQELVLLQQDFDFTVDEEYRFDREDVPWARDSAELKDLWRKQVKNDVLSLRLTGKEMPEIRETLRKRYEGILHRTRQMNSEDVFQIFADAYTFSLDPHTSYMSPQESENFDISMSLSLEGIGAVLNLENEYTEVQRTVPGGPAAQSGQLRSGDRIIGVGQGYDGEVADVVGWRLQDVVDLIRGPKGTVVRLQVLPKDAGTNGPSKLITLVRNTIKLEDQAAKKYIIEGLRGMGQARIGVIEVPAFYRDFQGYSEGDKDFRSTTRDVRKLLQELAAEKVDGIVIDLRQNGGGSLIEATELTGLFIPTGPVVQVRSSNGQVDVETDPDPQLVYGGPLAVLVNRFSASASEIFAGAIQDYGRGVIIGEPTFGKGTVQSLIELDRYVSNPDSNLGRLRITMAQFFRVNGGSTQFQGVVPDFIFPAADDPTQDGERSLDNALPWAKIRPANYTPSRLGSLDHYRELSRQRIQKDPGFQFLQNQEALLQSVRDQKVLSLQEQKRKQEWEQREQARKEREKQFRASVGLPPMVQDEPAAENMSPEQDEEEEAIKRVGANEAARILADYIAGQAPRAAMAR
jgi:carboxyl-terminal processing protease